jgi:hypothetical protein
MRLGVHLDYHLSMMLAALPAGELLGRDKEVLALTTPTLRTQWSAT